MRHHCQCGASHRAGEQPGTSNGYGGSNGVVRWQAPTEHATQRGEHRRGRASLGSKRAIDIRAAGSFTRVYRLTACAPGLRPKPVPCKQQAEVRGKFRPSKAMRALGYARFVANWRDVCRAYLRDADVQHLVLRNGVEFRAR